MGEEFTPPPPKKKSHLVLPYYFCVQLIHLMSNQHTHKLQYYMATRGKQEKLKTAFCHLLKQLIFRCLALAAYPKLPV